MAEGKVGGCTCVRVVFGLVLAKAFVCGEDAIRALGADLEANFLTDGHVCQVDVAAMRALYMADEGAFGTEAVPHSSAVLGAVMKGAC